MIRALSGLVLVALGLVLWLTTPAFFVPMLLGGAGLYLLSTLIPTFDDPDNPRGHHEMRRP